MAEKKYQLIVRGQHKTDLLEPLESVEYKKVQAENYEEAVNLAKIKYQETYADAEGIVAVPIKKSRIVAIVCLLVAVFLGFITWSGQTMLKPNMISTLAAIALYSAVIVRLKGLKNSFNSFSDILLSCLTIVFCASFLNLFLGDVKFDIKFFWLKETVEIPGSVVLGLGVLLSWLGIKAIAGIVWVILFILAAIQIITLSGAMGIWGMVYVLAAFLGIIFSLKEQSSYFLDDLRNDMASITARTGRMINRDIVASADTARKAASTVATKVKNRAAAKAAKSTQAAPPKKTTKNSTKKGGKK
jgi:hypothetical protein